jgi:hypothetical protein
MIRRLEVLSPGQQTGELRGIMDQNGQVLGADPQVRALVLK